MAKFDLAPFFSFLLLFVLANACNDHRLGAKQNNQLKRHLTPDKNVILQKSLDRFEKKFESIKNMPWDYKYRRHSNKIDWERPILGATNKQVQSNVAHSNVMATYRPTTKKFAHGDDMMKNYIHKSSGQSQEGKRSKSNNWEPKNNPETRKHSEYYDQELDDYID